MSLSYISIKPGETKVLKKSAKIISAINYGNVNYVSTCMDFNTENAQCYKMRWSSARSGASTAAPLYDIMLNYISILGVKYMLNINPEEEYSISSDTNIVENLMRSIVPQSLMKINNITVWTGSGATRFEFTMLFQSIPSIADTIEMKISEIEGSGHDGSFVESGLYIKPITATGCTAEDSPAL